MPFFGVFAPLADKSARAGEPSNRTSRRCTEAVGPKWKLRLRPLLLKKNCTSSRDVKDRFCSSAHACSCDTRVHILSRGCEFYSPNNFFAGLCSERRIGAIPIGEYAIQQRIAFLFLHFLIPHFNPVLSLSFRLLSTLIVEAFGQA